MNVFTLLADSLEIDNFLQCMLFIDDIWSFCHQNVFGQSPPVQPFLPLTIHY